MTALMGWIRVRRPTEMSTAPTTGISFHAHASGMPKVAKYGSHEALVMTPNAPWPMKHAATATRKIHCSSCPMPTSRPVELIALDGQDGESLAHLAAGPLVAGIVNSGVNAGEPSFLAQISPVARILGIHVADQLCEGAIDDRGVRHVGGMIGLGDQRHDRGVSHVWP